MLELRNSLAAIAATMLMSNDGYIADMAVLKTMMSSLSLTMLTSSMTGIISSVLLQSPVDLLVLSLCDHHDDVREQA